jgi:acyl carrier protein
MSADMGTDVREVLAQHAKLPIDVASLDGSDNLYQAGMSSHASVSVMLALEDRFDIEFPDAMLTRSAFESIDAITGAVAQLQEQAA